MTELLIGRNPELRQIAAARQRVGAGQSSVFVIEGEPGIGKTRLLNEVADQSTSEGWHVVQIRCAELDVDRPFVASIAALNDLADEFGRNDQVLPEELLDALSAFQQPRRLHARPPAAISGRASKVDGDTLVQLIVDGLGELARDRRTLLTIDDAQWADSATNRILWDLAGRRRSLPLFTIISIRATRRQEVQSLRRGLDAQGATNIVLNALSVSDSLELAEAIIGANLDEDRRLLADQILREARGNPLFIAELFRGTSDGENSFHVSDEGEIPQSLQSLVRRRFVALPIDTQVALRYAALLGVSFDINELAIAQHVELSDLVETLSPALDLRILVERDGAVQFQHGVVQRIIVDEHPLAIRHATHLAIARSLADARYTPTRVAEHYFLSEGGANDEIVRWLRMASDEVRPLSLESALVWTQRALDHCDNTNFFDTHLDVAGLLILLGRIEEAEHVCKSLTSREMTLDQEVRYRVAYCALITMTGRTRDPEAIAHLDWVRSVLDANDPQNVEFLGWKAILLVLSGALEEAELAARTALSLEVRGDRLPMLSRPLEALGLIALLRGDTVEALAYTKESTDTYHHTRNVFTSVMMPHFALAMAMISCKPIREVSQMLHSGLQICDRAGHGLARQHLEPITALTHFVAGELDLCRAVIDRPVDRNSNWRNTGVVLPTGTGLAAYMALMRDDLPVAAELAQRSFDELLSGGQQAGTSDFAVWCIACVAEASGDVEKARDLLVGVWELFAKDASLYTTAPDLVRLTRDDRYDFALDVVLRCEARAIRSDAPLDRANALCSRGFLEKNIAHVDSARRIWEDQLQWVLPPTRFHTLSLQLLDPATDRGELQTRMTEVMTSWNAMEATHPVRVLRETYGRFGVIDNNPARPTTGFGSLTKAERNVVNLVGEGLTNKEIAKHLYISHRTVDTHVSHALTKLGVTSRVQLASLVLRELLR